MEIAEIRTQDLSLKKTLIPWSRTIPTKNLNWLLKAQK